MNFSPSANSQNKTSPRVALVIGSGCGIGKHIALHLALMGFNVAITFKSDETSCNRVAAMIEEKGGRASVFQVDVSKESDVSRLFQGVYKTFGLLNILINNAGPYLFKSIMELTPDEWDYILQSNLSGCYYCCHHATPLLRESGWGRIINLSYAGVQSLQAEPDRTPYYIAKAGILALTRSYAVALAPYSITVNAIAPGIIENDSYSDQFRRSIPKKIPVGRIGRPQDIIQAVDLFIDEKSDFITGTCIEVAGGWRL